MERLVSSGFDPETTNLMSGALDEALRRLKTLGLVNGDASEASSALTKLIMEAVEGGEREQENLVLFAMGRFQAKMETGQRATE
jgi:hypothetical protein